LPFEVVIHLQCIHVAIDQDLHAVVKVQSVIGHYGMSAGLNDVVVGH
jgi:hypothetical protein